MASHPLNLILRFLLEMIALFAVGYWGYKQSDTWPRYIWAIVLPLAFACLWGIFNVPNDPSRSGKAPIAVAGFVRLMLELFLFATATFMIHHSGNSWSSLIFGIIVLIHYILSYDRIIWLGKN